MIAGSPAGGLIHEADWHAAPGAEPHTGCIGFSEIEQEPLMYSGFAASRRTQ